VTGLTGQRGRNVIDGFRHRCDSGKYLAVMASGTSSGNTRVVHCRARKIRELGDRVTDLTGQAGWQMVDWFVYRRNSREHLAVMTGITTAGDASVVHRRASKICELGHRVAYLAALTGRQVVERFRYRSHTNEILTGMACSTSIKNASMIHRCVGKVVELSCQVTYLARLAGR